ncbi:hypothetical protein HK405_003866 [Cladochytrium tenue]|nr:hypothetical protein HK405_003866 [Cladochytrium tenue]
MGIPVVGRGSAATAPAASTAASSSHSSRRGLHVAAAAAAAAASPPPLPSWLFLPPSSPPPLPPSPPLLSSWASYRHPPQPPPPTLAEMRRQAALEDRLAAPSIPAAPSSSSAPAWLWSGRAYDNDDDDDEIAGPSGRPDFPLLRANPLSDPREPLLHRRNAVVRRRQLTVAAGGRRDSSGRTLATSVTASNATTSAPTDWCPPWLRDPSQSPSPPLGTMRASDMFLRAPPRRPSADADDVAAAAGPSSRRRTLAEMLAGEDDHEGLGRHRSRFSDPLEANWRRGGGGRSSGGVDDPVERPAVPLVRVLNLAPTANSPSSSDSGATLSNPDSWLMRRSWAYRSVREYRDDDFPSVSPGPVRFGELRPDGSRPLPPPPDAPWPDAVWHRRQPLDVEPDWTSWVGQLTGRAWSPAPRRTSMVTPETATAATAAGTRRDADRPVAAAGTQRIGAPSQEGGLHELLSAAWRADDADSQPQRRDLVAPEPLAAATARIMLHSLPWQSLPEATAQAVAAEASTSRPAAAPVENLVQLRLSPPSVAVTTASTSAETASNEHTGLRHGLAEAADAVTTIPTSATATMEHTASILSSPVYPLPPRPPPGTLVGGTSTSTPAAATTAAVTVAVRYASPSVSPSLRPRRPPNYSPGFGPSTMTAAARRLRSQSLSPRVSGAASLYPPPPPIYHPLPRHHQEGHDHADSGGASGTDHLAPLPPPVTMPGEADGGGMVVLAAGASGGLGPSRSRLTVTVAAAGTVATAAAMDDRGSATGLGGSQRRSREAAASPAAMEAVASVRPDRDNDGARARGLA